MHADGPTPPAARRLTGPCAGLYSGAHPTGRTPGGSFHFMSFKVRCVSFAAFAWLTAASVCVAADSDYAPRKGGVGGSLGGSRFFGQGDYSEGARPRFSFAGSLRYVMSRHWRWQFSPGFTWSAYAKG